MKVQSKPVSKISSAEVVEIYGLWDQTWPHTIPKELTQEERIQDFFHREMDMVCHFMKEEGELIAYAESFKRVMKIAHQNITVLGLAAVCVRKSHRHLGLGRRLVLEAFERLTSEKLPFSLFQTGVLDFYLKIGACEINNRIVNTQNKQAPDENPFWDKHIMVYPSVQAAIKGTIDINGKGY